MSKKATVRRQREEKEEDEESEEQDTEDESSSSSSSSSSCGDDREDRSDELKHSIALVIGDWSNDGHGKTHRMHIRANIPAHRIQQLYTAAVKSKKLPFDFENEVAHNFEENFITVEQLKKLREAGVKHNFFGVEDGANEDQFIQGGKIDLDGPDGYGFLWLSVIQFCCGDKLKMEYHEPEILTIGGYGCFWM